MSSKALAGGDAFSRHDDDKPPQMIGVKRDTDGSLQSRSRGKFARLRCNAFPAVVRSKALAGGDAVSRHDDDKPPSMIGIARDTDG